MDLLCLDWEQSIVGRQDLRQRVDLEKCVPVWLLFGCLGSQHHRLCHRDCDNRLTYLMMLQSPPTALVYGKLGFYGCTASIHALFLSSGCSHYKKEETHL